MIKEIASHRSIRRFTDRPIPKETLTEILTAATRASNTGNMQVYSIIVTTDPEIKRNLAPCHFMQPSVMESAAVVTFCADIRRFSKWCEQRDAEPGYDNFAWFINGSIDALLASQNLTLEAEAHGLGICYLGTTIYTADKICEVLNLPRGVVPITTVVMGYPAMESPLTDRLPLEGVVHFQQYKDYSKEDIENIWCEKEASEESAKLIEENKLPNLAQIFTLNRYKAVDNVAISKSYLEVIKKQGFFNQE